MSVLLAGMILAVAAQAATPDTGFGTQLAPATELTIALDGPATQRPDLAPQAASTGTIPPAGVAESDEAAATVPLHYEAAGAASAPAEQAAPQRSVLTAFAKPSDLMRQLMKAPATSQLRGTPLTLGEAVRDARNRQEQTTRAKAYWDLAAAVGDYYLALVENTELNVLRQSIQAPAKQWDARLKEAQERVAIAHQAAQAAQLRLHQSLGRATGGALPLPADVPHCGRYNTEYEVIFAREPNLIARQLSELMPLRYTALRSQAQAVADAEAWRDQMSRQRDPAGDGLELLQSQDLLSLQRRTFIATAREYNEEIAEYTELAAPAEVAPDRLVAMMIRTSSASDDLPWRSSGVEQASAEEPRAPAKVDVQVVPPSGSVQQARGAQQTFSQEGGYREVRRPLQRLLDRDREHSILRRPIQRLRNAID
jgi:hypothetical protein